MQLLSCTWKINDAFFQSCCFSVSSCDTFAGQTFDHYFLQTDVGSSCNQWAAFFLVTDIFVHGKTVHPGHTCHRSNWATVNFMKAHCAGKHCIKIAMPCRSFKCQVQWVCWQETSDSCCSTSILLLSHHTKTANISHLHNVSTTQILCPFAVIGSMCRGLPAMQNASVEYHN